MNLAPEQPTERDMQVGLAGALHRYKGQGMIVPIELAQLYLRKRSGTAKAALSSL